MSRAAVPRLVPVPLRARSSRLEPLELLPPGPPPEPRERTRSVPLEELPCSPRLSLPSSSRSPVEVVNRMLVDAGDCRVL